MRRGKRVLEAGNYLKEDRYLKMERHVGGLSKGKVSPNKEKAVHPRRARRKKEAQNQESTDKGH